MAVFDELHTADIVFHGGGGEEIRGLKGFKQYCGEMFSVFPDLHYVIDDMVVEGDRVAVRTTWTCTYRSEGKGTQSKGRKVRAWEIEIDRVVDGKIAEVWNRYDTLGVMQQLGVAPTPEKGRPRSRQVSQP